MSVASGSRDSETSKPPVSPRVYFLDADPAASERGCNHVHGRQQQLGLAVAGQEILGLCVGQRLVGVELVPAAARELRDATTRIIRMRHGRDEAFIFETAEQSAHEA